MRARFISLISALALAVAGLVVFTGPAQAAPYITICNSGNSDAWIKAYNNDALKEYYIGYDVCVSVDNKNNMARVNLDPEYRGFDISCWQKKNLPLGSGTYGPKYNNEDSASNPYNSGTTSYRNDRDLNCPGFN